MSTFTADRAVSRRPRLQKRWLEAGASALYFWVQAGHRNTATRLAIDVLRDTAKRESLDVAPALAEMSRLGCNWAIETLIQGAWMREYHHWECDTKTYFDEQHRRNLGSAVRWRAYDGSRSHVAKVKNQLAMFAANVPAAALETIDAARVRINVTKHEAPLFASETDYESLVGAVQAFWEALEAQEEYVVRRMPA